MNWAAENPEKYDELQIDAIAHWLDSLYEDVWNSYLSASIMRRLAEALFYEQPEVADAILKNGVEIDWGGLVDDVMQQFETS